MGKTLEEMTTEKNEFISTKLNEDIFLTITPPPSEKAESVYAHEVQSIQYDDLTLSQLKKICRERHLPVTGRKSNLIEYLQLLDLDDYDLKTQLYRYGVQMRGSKPDLVRKLIKKRKRHLSCGEYPLK